MIAVITTDMSNQMENLYIETDMWKPFDKDLEKPTVCVTIKVKGKHITETEKQIISSERKALICMCC